MTASDPGLPQADPSQVADIGGVSLFTALQQLGLKPDARTGPAETLVVTRAELPSLN